MYLALFMILLLVPSWTNALLHFRSEPMGETTSEQDGSATAAAWNLPFEAVNVDLSNRRRRRKLQVLPAAAAAGKGDDPMKKKPKPPPPPSTSSQPCDPSKIDLANYTQWQDETGYWIGDYSFLDGNAKPFVSPTWNYPYDSYTGFITGNVKGNAYRQRNVFLYPPQYASVCATTSSAVVGPGKCGINGNSKVFMADQTATNCSSDPALAGDIEGPYFGVFDTFTELIGATNNALLYQVYLQGLLFQSQLTTITASTNHNGTSLRRTRSAQGFDANGVPNSVSYYREFKVTKDEFYQRLAAQLVQYNILFNDTCTWIDPPSGFGPPQSSGLPPGIDGCRQHLEQSFQL